MKNIKYLKQNSNIGKGDLYVYTIVVALYVRVIIDNCKGNLGTSWGICQCNRVAWTYG